MPHATSGVAPTQPHETRDTKRRGGYGEGPRVVNIVEDFGGGRTPSGPSRMHPFPPYSVRYVVGKVLGRIPERLGGERHERPRCFPHRERMGISEHHRPPLQQVDDDGKLQPLCSCTHPSPPRDYACRGWLHRPVIRCRSPLADAAWAVDG